MEKKILQFIKQNDLVPASAKTIYVATSGGADSMALLAFMKKHMTQDIVAVHVNHGIRGIAANGDELFVRLYCAEQGIPLIIHNARDAGIVIPDNASEEWARNLRYDFFETLATDDSLIATAHTLSDQAETVLFRLARGCGMKGLSGIPVRRDNFIRPFLCISRKDTEALSKQYGINFITDETNLSDDYSRNKIRHHALPVLREINPQVEQNVNRLCRRMSDANDFITSCAWQLFRDETIYCPNTNRNWLDTKALRALHPALLGQVLLMFLDGYEVDETILERVQETLLNFVPEDDTEVVLYSSDLADGHTLILTSNVCGIRTTMPVIIPTPNATIEFGSWGKTIRFARETYAEFVQNTQNNKRELAYYLNGDKFPLSSLRITAKEDGDEFKPACRYKTKVVKHLTKYALIERQEVPVLRNADGDILYLYGTGCTDNCLPDEDTKYIYHIIEG